MSLPKVAFVCVHNSCRSQIAEALGKALAGDVFESYSAGTETKPQINQDAVRLMKEVKGIDMEQTQCSKLLADIPAVDIVVTMGCNVQCPMLPCKHREDWGLEDPSGKQDAAFLQTIATITEKIIDLKERVIEMEHPVYTETFDMKFGEGDVQGRVRPGVLMRYVEHVSLKHADSIGLTQAFTQSHDMVFLIAKQGISFKRMPRAGETLTFVTTPERSKRITFRRVTLIYDAAGQEVACVDSLWVLMDTNTHKLLRRSPVAFDAKWTNAVDSAVDLKIGKAAQLEDVGTLCALYTHCDGNGHVNNVNYFDIVCDALPIEYLREKTLQRMVVNYHRELVLGEQMILQIGETEQGVYVTGSKDGLVTFEAICDFT